MDNFLKDLPDKSKLEKEEKKEEFLTKAGIICASLGLVASTLIQASWMHAVLWFTILMMNITLSIAHKRVAFWRNSFLGLADALRRSLVKAEEDVAKELIKK